MANLLHELLSLAGTVVVGQSDRAGQAVAEIESLHPDVIVVDVALREGNGFDVLAATRALRARSRMVAIVLSNYALQAYRDAAARLGVEYYFDKSTDILKVMGVLRGMGRPAVCSGGQD